MIYWKLSGNSAYFMQLRAKYFPHSWVHGRHSNIIKGRDYQRCLDMEKVWPQLEHWFLLFLSREIYSVSWFQYARQQGFWAVWQKSSVDCRLGKKKEWIWMKIISERKLGSSVQLLFIPSRRRCLLHFKGIHINKNNSTNPPIL